MGASLAYLGRGGGGSHRDARADVEKPEIRAVMAGQSQTYAYPLKRCLPVAEVTAGHLMAVLQLT